MKNILFKKPYTKCGVEATSITIYEKSKLSLCLDQQAEIVYSLFLLYVQVYVYQNTLQLRCLRLAFTLYKAFFLKKKKRSRTSLPASFSPCFSKKYSHHVMFW